MGPVHDAKITTTLIDYYFQEEKVVKIQAHQGEETRKEIYMLDRLSSSPVTNVTNLEEIQQEHVVLILPGPAVNPDVPVSFNS